MTTKNRTLEGKNRMLGGMGVKNRQTLFMDDLLPDYLCHRQYVICCANLFKLQFKKTGLIIDIFLSFPFFQIQTCP